MLKDKSSAKNKKSNFKSNFLCDGAKNRPPNLGFWISYLAQFQIIYAISQKNLLGARETEMLKDKSKAKNKKI